MKIHRADLTHIAKKGLWWLLIQIVVVLIMMAIMAGLGKLLDKAQKWTSGAKQRATSSYTSLMKVAAK